MKVTGNLFEAKMRPEQVFRLMKACAIVRWLGLSTTNTAICCSLGVVKGKMPQNDPKKCHKMTPKAQKGTTS
jgi:hypothetical protein